MKDWKPKSFCLCTECCCDRGENECIAVMENEGLTFDEEDEGCGLFEEEE